MRSTIALVALAVGLVAAGCGGTGDAGSKSATTRRPATTGSTPERAKAKPPSDGLTGFGATVAAWDEHHSMDRRFSPGSAYDPDPSLGDGERSDDRYYAVDPQGGRVMFYSMRFPAQTGIEEAKRFVLVSEFPRDAGIIWFKRKGTCAQMLVRSSGLGRITGSGALVRFTSGDAGDYYDARAVSDATLSPGSATAYSAHGIDC